MLSGLESLFLLPRLRLNTTGGFTKKDGEGDKAPVAPPATAGFPAWHQRQEHALLRGGISVPCSLAADGQQHLTPLPFRSGDARKGQCCPGGISRWSSRAKGQLIPL